jgi:hypothetical protein
MPSTQTQHAKWNRVSRAAPCPICKHLDWCRVSSDRAIAACNRVQAGSFKTKTDKNGALYYLHHLHSKYWTDSAPQPPDTAAAPERAGPDRLNQVYTALLAGFPLTQAHQKNLCQRGLSAAEIAKRRYASLPIKGRPSVAHQLWKRFGEAVLQVPGVVIKERNSRRYLTIAGRAGLLIPVRDEQGRIIALRVRLDAVPAGESKYRWLSSNGSGGPGPGSPVHVPLGVVTPAGTVRLTEGELKSDISVVLSELPTISIPGVGNWRPALDALTALGAKSVRLAFDMDATEKPEVARALLSCAEVLREEGYSIELEQWDVTYKGIDDLLASGGSPEVHRGDAAEQALQDIARAAGVAESPPPPPCPYYVVGGGIVRVQATRDGAVEVPLCNFQAQITEQVHHDDGAEQALTLTIAGKMPSGAPLAPATVRSEQFASMDWVVPNWGTQAVIYAGAGTRDHLRAALQLLSGAVPQRIVYTHTGWREIGGSWSYLHAGGAIGSEGSLQNLAVELPDALAAFQLPAPPRGVTWWSRFARASIC